MGLIRCPPRARSTTIGSFQLLESFPNGNPAVMREAAVRILDGSTVSKGPTTVATFDRQEVEDRLGDALPYVITVERILLERGEIYPVFTVRGDLPRVSG